MRVWNGSVLRQFRRSLTIAVVCLTCVVGLPETTRAQGAREFLNTPVNQWSASVDFIKGKGQTAPSSDLPLPNNHTITGLVFPFVLWSFPQRQKYGGVSLSTPYTSVEVSGANGTVEASGFGDPGIGIHYNIFGLPALRRDQMATAVPQTFLTVRLTTTAPLGKYDRDSPVNVGANRWSFTPMFNLNITPDKGVQWIEFYTSGRFFTKNDEFQGDQTLSQDPLLILTGHYSRNFGRRWWASIGVSYDYGGRTSIDHVAQDDRANGLRPGVALSGLFGPVRLIVRYENTSTTPNAAPRNAQVVVRAAALLF